MSQFILAAIAVLTLSLAASSAFAKSYAHEAPRTSNRSSVRNN